MDQNGWIKIHRKLFSNPVVCKDGSHLALWIYILGHAAYEEHDIWFEGKRITLKPGQLVTGRKKLSHFLDISESKVDRILKCFENEQQIEQQMNSHGRLISVINWASYQESEQPNEQPVSSHRAASEQPVNTTKERKEREEGKEEEASASDPITEAWNTLPEPVPKVSRIVKGSTRDTKLRKRIADYGQDKVLQAIDNIRDSNFLCGGGSKGFVVTFDWFIGPENFQKVLEGNYNDKQTRDPPEEAKEDSWDRMWRLYREHEKASGGT